jgi:hypothetical protein
MHRESSNAAQSVRDELARLLADEREGILQTINHYFADTLRNIRQERMIHRFRKMGVEEDSTYVLNMDQLLKRAHLSNDDQAVNDIHDTLKAYYKVALKRFMDNVVNSVVERHLLGVDGPVRFLGPEFVSSLSDEDLAAISQEDEGSMYDRREAHRRSEMFKEALAVVRGL